MLNTIALLLCGMSVITFAYIDVHDAVYYLLCAMFVKSFNE